MQTYWTIAEPVTGEIEEKRSRFWCQLAPVADEDAARAVIATARSTHWDARHHCSAFILGPDARVERSSDDGEPAGTAGAPMLDVLRGTGLSDVVAVVTRWFGGTLLGAGGLVRAYSDAVRAAVANAAIITRGLVAEWDVVASHADAGRVESTLRAEGFEVVDHTWGAQVVLRVLAADGDRLAASVAALTHGGPAPVRAGERWVTQPSSTSPSR